MVHTAISLRNQGVKVRIVEGRPSVVTGLAPTLEVRVLANRRGFLSDTIAVVGLARRTKSDFIYAYSDFFPETIVPSLFASLITRKRLLVNITHNTYKAEDGRIFLGLISSRAKKEPKIKPVLSFAIFHAARRMGCRTGTCFVKSHFMESYARSRLHAQRVFLVGGGVDKVWYDRTGAEKSVDCVYSGRFDSHKRVSNLIKAWQEVCRKKPDAKLLLIGETGDEFPLVKQLVKDLGLSSNVIFAGFVNDRRALAERVRSAKLFVSASVQEGFGLAVAEAMAAGLPCVLSDVEPMRELFGEAALLVRPDDPLALSDAILRLLLDEDERSELSGKSESLSKRFSWDSVAERTLASLRTLT